MSYNKALKLKIRERKTVKGLHLYAWYSTLCVATGLKNKQDKHIFSVLSP